MDALSRVLNTETISFGNLCVGRIDLHEHFTVIRWAVEQKLSMKSLRTKFIYADKTIVMEPKRTMPAIS
jgi:hypothetical protein